MNATRDAGKLKVTYNVPSAPANSTYPIRVEFFLADAKGQGKTYLGFDTFSNDDFTAGSKTANFTTNSPIKVSDKIVATATDNSGLWNTSEFSAQATIVSPWQNQNPGRLRWDVTDDTFVSADVLEIINYINAGRRLGGEAEATSVGEAPAEPTASQSSVPRAQSIASDVMALLAMDVAAQTKPKRRM